MLDSSKLPEFNPESSKHRLDEKRADAKDHSRLPAPIGPATQPSDAKESEETTLTPEEQMALYEEHLKETDWGHQPC